MRLPLDLKHVPTQQEVDIRRAVQLEKYGLLAAFVAIISLLWT